MPQSDSLIRPREGGHIDLPDDLVEARVGLSVSPGADDIILHVDVATGGDVEVPFSVGIHLAPADVTRLMLAVRECITQQAGGRAERDGRLN